MENLTNIELIVKIVIGLIGAIATIGKLRNLFANSKLKEEVKVDLEILEKIRNTNIHSAEIEEKIKKNVEKAYDNKNENFSNFLYGISLFVGFGFWTINLLGDFQKNFNAWSVLTLFISFIGLSIAFINDNREEKEENKYPFLLIGLYEKTNFKFILFILLFTSFLTPILIWKINEFSWWIFLSTIFLIMSIKKLSEIIRKVN